MSPLHALRRTRFAPALPDRFAPGGWPTLCVGCGQWALQPVCASCSPRPGGTACEGCGRALPTGADAGTPRLRCGACLRQPPPWRSLVAATDYRCPWPQLVARLKYQQQPGLAKPLAAVLARAVAQAAQRRAAAGAPTAEPVSRLLAMPLSRRRLAERGYNQAWELARQLARLQGLPASPDALQRWRDTPAQVGQDRQARLANLRDAFWVPPASRAMLQGRVVALVDDVTTTGATARAATEALLQAGTAAVELWVLARAPAPDEHAAGDDA